jgi:hypothetical protein
VGPVFKPHESDNVPNISVGTWQFGFPGGLAALIETSAPGQRRSKGARPRNDGLGGADEAVLCHSLPQGDKTGRNAQRVRNARGKHAGPAALISPRAPGRPLIPVPNRYLWRRKADLLVIGMRIV